MTWKVVNITDTGTASKFGADDMDKVSKGFAGIDVDDYDINADWTFRSGKLNLRNPANTFSYNIVPAAIAANRTLNLPLTTATDTFTVNGLAQTLSSKTLDSTCTISSSSSLPSTVVKTDAANVMGEFDTSFPDNRIRIYNPAGTFRTTLINSAIAADRNLTLPLITGPDTLASLGLAQTFTAKQTVSISGATSQMSIYRPENTAALTWNLDFDAQDSANNQTTYASVRGEIADNTDTSEDGNLKFRVMIAGTMTDVASVHSTGDFKCGGANRRVVFQETGLTAGRNYTFPDANSLLIGNDATDVTLADGKDFALGSSSGTKIGTATTQKLGFFNKTPIAQKAANADTSGASLAALETEVNELKQLLRDYGLMA